MNLKRFSACFTFGMLLFLVPVLVSSALPGQNREICVSKAEQLLIDALQAGDELSMDLVTALMVAEGVEDSSAISDFKNKLNILLSDLGQRIKPEDSHHKKSKTIFDYLHKNVFKKYVVQARFQNVFLSHEYNCVTATAIFYFACQRYGIPITLYETPTHVYSTVGPVGKRTVIELTDPRRGFDPKDNKDEFIDYLLEYKFITAEELAEKGADVIYNEHTDQAEEIEPKSLIDIIYFNCAVDFMSNSKYQEALCQMEKAIRLDSGNELYQSTYFDLLISANPPQMEFMAYSPYLVRAFALFKDQPNYQKALLPSISRLAEHFDSRQNYADGAMFLEQLRGTAVKDSSIHTTLLEYDQMFQKRWVSTMYLRGEFEAAYLKTSQLKMRYPADPRINDLYAALACDYARHLVAQGKTTHALTLLDSLTLVLADYPIIRELHVRTLLTTIRYEDFKGGDSTKLKKTLLKAYSLTPSDPTICQMLGGLHHEMAMSKIREDKIAEAYKITEEGLKYDPANRLLKEDLEQIKELLINMKKK